MNSTGMQGWKDYKSLMNQVKLADYNFTKESKGASMEDVDKFFKKAMCQAKIKISSKKL